MERTDPNMSRPEAVKWIRSQLGCGLVEANDFFLKDPPTFASRLDVLRADMAQTNAPYITVEEKIREVIREYYRALNQRKHGGLAQDNAFQRIQDILGMQWDQGK